MLLFLAYLFGCVDMDTTSLNRIGTRLRSGDLHRALGRFRRFRAAYSVYQNNLQRLQPTAYVERLHPRETSLFEGIDPDRYARELRARGVSFGFSLTPSQVAEIYTFACETVCSEPGFDDEFYASEVEAGQLRGDRYCFRGLVKQPENCPLIQTLAEDPALLSIVRRYLRYWPSKLTFHLTWTFAVAMPEAEQRKRYPPLNYHYDVAGYNFMTTYFYLTDVDAESGAHVMIERSHNQKPLHTLFGYGASPQLAQQVLSHYGADSELSIEGKAGFGFVQDPSCFHRLSAPTKGRRLLLQIRYS